MPFQGGPSRNKHGENLGALRCGESVRVCAVFLFELEGDYKKNLEGFYSFCNSRL